MSIQGLAVDSKGYIYFTDGTNVFKLVKYTDPTTKMVVWTQYTIAGATFGYTGGLAVEPDGSHLYVTDESKNTLVQLAHDAGQYTPTTIATGLNVPTFVALSSTGILVSNSGANELIEVSSAGSGKAAFTAVLGAAQSK